jgi:hypothetical protein
MQLPNLEDLCVELTVTPQNLSLTFPGGAALDAQLPDIGIPDPMELSKQLMAQANAALAPLVPVFNVIDTVLALFQAVKAIPDAITHLDPTKITDALPDVAQKAENRAAELGNAQLQTVVDCSRGHVAAQLQSLAESAAPVNRLIALINVFTELVGLGPLPDLSNLGRDAEAALKPLDDTVKR